MNSDPSARIADSWIVNAEAWTTAVREGRIASRRAATDHAIVDAVLACAPQRVLDVGCGEGWLCRALAEHAVETFGIDASPPLIEAARAIGGAGYAVCDYRQLIDSPSQFGRFNAVICNFALLEECIDPLLIALRNTLEHRGALLIQTVHPRTACGDLAYVDGWRNETFAAFGDAFRAQMPWYFRTLESWCETLSRCGYEIEILREPAHPETGQALSLLLVARPRG
jgi:2-polyprenyl-3-methyl-5-hydroxy-6-metoxy-1,4-benzoquinol methylase